MSFLADTNVMLRVLQPEHPSHNAAVQSLAGPIAAGEPVFFTSQNIAEFWNVATRPIVQNGLGFSLARVARETDNIERVLTLLGDTPDIYQEWKRLVIKHAVRGSKVHDARLVAAMHVHAVTKILTFNGADFKRYDVEVLHPAASG
jgi:predicted nucleic acid-binding protein